MRITIKLNQFLLHNSRQFFYQIQSFRERDIWMTVNMLLYKLCCIYTQKKHQLDNEFGVGSLGERYEKKVQFKNQTLEIKQYVSASLMSINLCHLFIRNLKFKSIWAFVCQFERVCMCVKWVLYITSDLSLKTFLKLSHCLSYI